MVATGSAYCKAILLPNSIASTDAAADHLNAGSSSSSSSGSSHRQQSVGTTTTTPNKNGDRTCGVVDAARAGAAAAATAGVEGRDGGSDYHHLQASTNAHTRQPAFCLPFRFKSC